MIRTLVRSSMAVLAVTLCGCSMFQPDKQTLSINCTVPDTIVKVNGDRFNCPAKVDVRRDIKVMLEASKEGYEPYFKTIDYHFSTSAKWDAIGAICWLVPAIGFLSPGAWDLDQTELNIELFAVAKK